MDMFFSKWLPQLIMQHRTINQLKKLSGFTYSDEGGMNITAAEQDAWDVYTSVSICACSILIPLLTDAAEKSKGCKLQEQIICPLQSHDRAHT